MTNIRKSSQINFHSSKSVHGSVAGPEPDAPIYNYTTGLFINIFPISKYFLWKAAASSFTLLLSKAGIFVALSCIIEKPLC